MKALQWTGENHDDIMKEFGVNNYCVQLVEHTIYNHSFKCEKLLFKTAINNSSAFPGDMLILMDSGAIEPIHHELFNELLPSF